MNRAVFLDRDGVLNRAMVREGRPHEPKSVAELELLPGVSGALTALKAGGFYLIVVTNQPNVARGKQRREVVEAMNAALKTRLPLDDIFVCYHDDPDHCECRKPRPGLLMRATEKYAIDLSMSYIVGDRWRDIEAGCHAGCHTILIDYHYAEPLQHAPEHRANSLVEAADWILAQRHGV